MSKSKEEIHNEVYLKLKPLGGGYTIQKVIDTLDELGYLNRNAELTPEQNEPACPACESATIISTGDGKMICLCGNVWQAG